ncbi:MAG: O-antigen translocase [Prevotella sp.]|nr:O-antigen translocase [Prevotella sp.]
MNKNASYKQIIKSTSIFGGSQFLIILIGIIRTKIVAVLLGPVGVGIIGIYQSIIDMMRSGYSLGLDTAGVKEIAEADGKEDRDAFHKTVTRFNRWFKALALAGLVSCVVFCYPISLWVFEDSSYALPIALLSMSVFLAILTTGKSSVLQGMRKIPEMAKSAILGSLFGLIFSIPVYYFWGLEGIVPAFIGTGLISFLCVEFYYRKQHVKDSGMSNNEAFKTGLGTLKLGIFIVISALVSTVSMLLVRAFITRNTDIDAAGLFQAAWTITNVYLGLILRSMGSDFFPRLSAVADKKEQVKNLVNEQSYIVLIIASPVIVGMLLFSDFALTILYSDKFAQANGLLCWQIAGSFFKVLSWPIAFIMLAKNKGLLFFITEVIYYAVYLLSSYLLYPRYGLEALGIGYLAAYIVYLPVVFIIGYRVSAFGWRKNVLIMTVINLVLIAAAFYSTQYMDGHKLLPGAIALCLALLYAYFNLRKVFSLKDIKGWHKKE